MGILVRDQFGNDNKPLYQVGLQKTLLIIGLGNPGDEYDLTRHNIGFYCLDHFAANAGFGAWTTKKSLHSLLTIQNIGGTRVILCKPQTFMNNSGQAVQAVQQFYKISPENSLIVHDELDIPFGQIRLRQGGGSAGHNGLKSIIAQSAERGDDGASSDNSGRVRIGIHNSLAGRADSADFVLGKFSKTEQAKLTDLASTVNQILQEFVASGILSVDTRQFI
ncbi:MAG: aminoacyl-tRNA hydrolase [Candidatus Saccharimonadales bacterium]